MTYCKETGNDYHMKHIVYLTTNLVNSKKYIGVHQTDDPETFDGYLGCGIYAAHRIKNPDTPFQKAVLKYGAESFRRETLFVFENRDEAYEKEHELVNIEWISRDDTYNVAIGGACSLAPQVPIYQYAATGEYITTQESLAEAGNSFGVSGQNISRAATNKHQSCGYLWSFKLSDYVNPDDYFIEKNKKFVDVVDLQTGEKKIHISLTEAANMIGCYVTTVKRGIIYSRAIYKRYKCTWNQEFLNDDKKVRDYVVREARKVGQYGSDGELIKVYNSVREAKKVASGVPLVLSGDRKRAGGYMWKYMDN